MTHPIKRVLMVLCAAATTVLVLAAPPAHAATTLFSDWFAADTVGTTYSDGSNIRTKWHVDFLGFGSASITTDGTNHFLTTAPKASTTAGETHATLVTTQASFSGSYTLKPQFGNESQLRTGTPPNAWERAWTLWNVNVDASGCYSFDYLILKTNGWELGKDTCSGGVQTQTFLATGSSPTYPLGAWLTEKITQTVNGSGQPTWVIQVKKNNGSFVTLATFTDTTGALLTAGKLGLYAEDARVDWGGADVVTP